MDTGITGITTAATAITTASPEPDAVRGRAAADGTDRAAVRRKARRQGRGTSRRLHRGGGRRLARAPANSRRWALLSAATVARDGPTEQAAQLLATSFLTGLYDSRLALFRTALGFRTYDKLDENTRKLLLTQIGVAWRVSHDEL